MYRKGFELIYKQLLDNVAKLGVERIDPVGKLFDPHQHQAMDRLETTIMKTARSCRPFSQVTCFTDASCARRWCA